MRKPGEKQHSGVSSDSDLAGKKAFRLFGHPKLKEIFQFAFQKRMGLLHSQEPQLCVRDVSANGTGLQLGDPVSLCSAWRALPNEAEASLKAQNSLGTKYTVGHKKWRTVMSTTKAVDITGSASAGSVFFVVVVSFLCKARTLR